MDKKKNVNALCVCSLACYLGYWLPAVVGIFITWLIQPDLSSSEGFLVALCVLAVFFICWGIRITAWILMIVARVKNSKNKFAIALMWIYIGLLIMGVVTYILLIAMSLFFTIASGPVISEFVQHF